MKTTDIEAFSFRRQLTIVAWCLILFFLADTVKAQTLPAGTSIQIRLRQTLSSYGSKAKNPVRALVIAPVEVNGR